MRITIYLLWAVMLVLNACERKGESLQPNFLFILADDLTYNILSPSGNRQMVTPTLDELARTGTKFTTAYNMGGWHGAICVASRTMFNTGRFLWRAQGVETRLDTLAQGGQFWSLEMAKLGYETYLTGKWHVNVDPTLLFHHVGTVRGGMPRDVPEMYQRPLDEQDHLWTPWDTAFGGYWSGGKHWSEVVADETMDFLELAAGSEKPFFMYVAFNAPHDPRQSPREFVEMYPLEKIGLPDSFLPEYPFKDDMGCGSGLRDERLAPFPRSKYAVRVHRQEYFAIISHLDAQIGRILQRLEKRGLDRNTYVIFTADQGLAVGEHGLMGKQNMYDHSMRSPLIIAGPGIGEGEEQTGCVYLQDVMPTVLEYAGGLVPDYVEFHSLKPILDQTGAMPGYPEIYGAYMDLQRMIRAGDHKLIVYPVAGVCRLFDLALDPGELHDLAPDPRYRERIETLYRQMVELQDEMGDTLDLTGKWRPPGI